MIEQAAVVFVQVVSSDHQAIPRHDQVESLPQEPDILLLVIPVEQANSKVLLQEPFTGHGGFSLPQVISSDPPLSPRQLQLDIQPHEPGSFADEVPTEQANWVVLSHAPLMTQSGLDLVQVRSSDHPPAPRHDQVADPPQEPAILENEAPVVQAN